jgi:hypothetical protein
MYFGQDITEKKVIETDLPKFKHFSKRRFWSGNLLLKRGTSEFSPKFLKINLRSGI